MRKFKCTFCGEEHEIDKYGWSQTCVGYIQVEDDGNIKNYEKILEEGLKMRFTKNNTKGKTRSK